jgi:hypothetical protein
MKADEPIVRRATLIAGSDIVQMDVIRANGHFWLVPTWFVNRDEGWRAPERVVLLDSLVHHAMPGPIQFLVESPIPKDVFFGDETHEPADEYVVFRSPDIQLPLPEQLN